MNSVKPRLALWLTGRHLVLQRLPPVTGARVELAAPITHSSLRAMLEQALDHLKAEHQKPLARLDLEVQIGLSHAHIGVMDLAAVPSAGLTSTACEAYARAWATQMLHLDPTAQVIRWQMLKETQKLLISCVDLQVFESLNAFCVQHGLRFVSCRPAILSAVGQLVPPSQGAAPVATDTTLVWTEPGLDAPRSSSVQMLHLKGREVSSSWRGWLPPPPRAHAIDEPLQGAIRRFQSRCGNPGGTPLTVHWPAASANAAADVNG